MLAVPMRPQDAHFSLCDSVVVSCDHTAFAAGGYSQRIFVKQVTKVLEDLLRALKSQE